MNINSIEDLLGALNFGSSIRQTDATAINAKSSRSHAVFSINLIQRKNKGSSTPALEKRFSVPIEAMSNADSWVTIDSKLHFVDLAGSERLKNTGASGDRAKEGISINGGLASLGKVISQLSSRHPGSHVSYRDSKLTRLLQDSLGGNAITYMIACVTPAEFHLSETLNTVQYAQHARAIQSKPRIQQVSDDSDKQAVIDRLRAEVSFLRDQIRNSERGDRHADVSQERGERQNEREIELQNHLLDVQENYTALGQRHAKLISEITKARDNKSSDTPTLTEIIGDSAVERLKRSNSFAEAVEQVVLEYEKTIESLETSLSKTRSSLAATESSLLEKETKCAYVETINQQLQNRVQKMMDRELSTENYLRDLESKIDGQSSGEEKNSAVVVELRKEIARIRENEASCEEYISTLEERLAETDQDMELMQREVDRLEHVVERQRSLGKLDNLLYEFDHIHQNGNPQEANPPIKSLTNGVTNEGLSPRREKKRSDSILQQAMTTAIPDSDDEDWDHPLATSPEHRKPNHVNGKNERDRSLSQNDILASSAISKEVPSQQNPVQSKFMADKFENVSQELFDLRVEHEATVNEYDLMSAKYEEALRTLAELQDAVDEARHPAPLQTFSTPISTRPTSFLGDARVNELKDGGHLSSSRSLSSELSLAGDSTSPFEQHPAEVPQKSILAGDSALAPPDERLLQEIEELKKVQREKDRGMVTLNSQYLQLEELHQETLDIVEELKAEVQKAMLNGSNSATPAVIRRKASQNVMTIDRAHRSLASLRNIAAENFEDKPDTMQNFELNINTAMHELHQRSERVQALEAELSSMKKEMEGKMTMISGLTRERSSLKGSSPIDISVVSSIHNQLLETKSQMEAMQEDHRNREQELLGEVEALKKSTNSQFVKSGMPGVFPETPAASIDEPDEKQLGAPNAQSQQVIKLQEELRLWQEKHTATVNSMHASEQKFMSTIKDLETSISSAGIMHDQKSTQLEDKSGSVSAEMHQLERERADHAEAFGSLQQQISEHKDTIDLHVSKIAELERSYLAARQEVEEGALYKETTHSQLDLYRDQISVLENQLEKHISAVEFHKHGLKSLHDSHAKALEDTRSASQAEAQTYMKSQLQEALDEMDKQYREKEELLVSSIRFANQQLNELAGSRELFENEGRSLDVQSRLMSELITTIKAEVHSTREDGFKAKKQISDLEAIVLDMKSSYQQNVAELRKVNDEKEKATRLVDELEDQLSSTYETHRATSSRLSMLNSNRDQALQDANAAKLRLEEELESHRVRLSQLEVRFTEFTYLAYTNVIQAQFGTSPYSNGPQSRERSDSLTSNLRKSASIASLPSPPPAIPLPPLPTNMLGLSSPPMTNGVLPLSIKDESVSAQYAEDQDARIRTIEKHLFAEKQLTATLEEALGDLESQGNKIKADMEAWKKKAWSYEDELALLRKERNSTRYSVQAVEEERNARKEAEAARAHLEERMAAINKKKKKNAFNCF